MAIVANVTDGRVIDDNGVGVPAVSARPALARPQAIMLRAAGFSVSTWFSPNTAAAAANSAPAFSKPAPAVDAQSPSQTSSFVLQLLFAEEEVARARIRWVDRADFVDVVVRPPLLERSDRTRDDAAGDVRGVKWDDDARDDGISLMMMGRVRRSGNRSALFACLSRP